MQCLSGVILQMSQDLTSDSLRGECVRFSLWYYDNCSGIDVHSICNFGMDELPLVSETFEIVLQSNSAVEQVQWNSFGTSMISTYVVQSGIPL